MKSIYIIILFQSFLPTILFSQVKKVHYIIEFDKLGDTSKLYEFDKSGNISRLNIYGKESGSDKSIRKSNNNHSHRIHQYEYKRHHNISYVTKEIFWGFIEDITYCKNFDYNIYKCTEEITMTLNMPFLISSIEYVIDSNLFLRATYESIFDTSQNFPNTKCYTDSCLNILKTANSTKIIFNFYDILNKRCYSKIQPVYLPVDKTWIESKIADDYILLENDEIISIYVNRAFHKCKNSMDFFLDSIFNSNSIFYRDSTETNKYYAVSDQYGKIGPFYSKIPYCKNGYIYSLEGDFLHAHLGKKISKTYWDVNQINTNRVIKQLRFSGIKWEKIKY